jgi:hypothetical protein
MALIVLGVKSSREDLVDTEVEQVVVREVD